MTGFLRGLVLLVMLPLTTRAMGITNGLLQADRDAQAAQKRRIAA